MKRLGLRKRHKRHKKLNIRRGYLYRRLRDVFNPGSDVETSLGATEYYILEGA